jgi:hypothetical protein
MINQANGKIITFGTNEFENPSNFGTRKAMNFLNDAMRRELSPFGIQFMLVKESPCLPLFNTQVEDDSIILGDILPPLSPKELEYESTDDSVAPNIAPSTLPRNGTNNVDTFPVGTFDVGRSRTKSQLYEKQNADIGKNKMPQ